MFKQMKQPAEEGNAGILSLGYPLEFFPLLVFIPLFFVFFQYPKLIYCDGATYK